MAGPANVTAPINWVAIDIARYWNAVLVETAAGKRYRFKMANSAADFDRLVGFLRADGGLSPPDRPSVARWPKPATGR
jgi:hypothetical protein